MKGCKEKSWVWVNKCIRNQQFVPYISTRQFHEILFLIVTVALQFLSVLTLKLLDNFFVIIGIFILSLLIGGLIKFSKTTKKSIVANIGWGLYFGSLTSLGLVIIFMIWLSFNFNNWKTNQVDKISSWEDYWNLFDEQCFSWKRKTRQR